MIDCADPNTPRLHGRAPRTDDRHRVRRRRARQPVRELLIRSRNCSIRSEISSRQHCSTSQEVAPAADPHGPQAGWGKVWDIAARATASRRAISPVIRSASVAKRSSRSSSGTLRYERNRLSNAAKSSLIAAALVCVGVGCAVSTLSCFPPEGISAADRGLVNLDRTIFGVVRSSEVVVEHELPRVRPLADLVELLGSLVVEPCFNQVVGEDAALEEEVVIGLEGVQDRLQ